jgi:hypothetical protein
MLVLVGPTSNGEGLLCLYRHHVWSHFVLVPNRNSHLLLSQTSHCFVRGKEMNEINQSINQSNEQQSVKTRAFIRLIRVRDSIESNQSRTP